MLQKVQEIQIRLIVGLLALYVAASLLFGTSLVAYGVASAIRWCIYITGATFVITAVGWPSEMFKLLMKYADWVITTNEKYQILVSSVEPETGFSPVEIEVEDMAIVSDIHIGTSQFLQDLETAVKCLLPKDIDTEEARREYRNSLLTTEEKREFDALWIAFDSLETSRIILDGPKVLEDDVIEIL